MELDAARLAIGRVERALSRLEQADLSPRGAAAAPRQGDLLTGAWPPPPDDAALRLEVRAVVAELDRLIAEAAGG